MTVHKTAYDTAACAGFVMKRTADAVKTAAAHGWLNSADGLPVRMVQGSVAVENDIPPFAHPLLVDDFIVTDMRAFGRWDNAQQQFNVRNGIDYALALQRAKLNLLWVSEAPTMLRDISQLPLAIFCSWISEAVAKRFALDPAEQYKLSMLAGIFYNSLFTDAEELSESEKLRLVAAISRAMRCSATDVIAMTDEISVIPNASAFCTAAKEFTGSVRLHELNVGLLFSILGGTWYGTNSKEMVAVALEHPPTWISILVAAFNERSFKNSGITKLTERNGFKNAGQDFVRAVLNLLTVTAK